MAAGDLIQVRKIITEAGLTSTNGIAEPVTLADFLLLLPSGGAAGSTTAVVRQTAPAAAAVPFADLTAAANSFNALRTALIASGVLV